MSARVINELVDLAETVSECAYAPYSGKSTGVAILLSTGEWIPGVRVENASFPLTISAIRSGVLTALSAGRNDVVALAKSTPLDQGDLHFLELSLGGDWSQTGASLLMNNDAALPSAIGQRFDIYQSGTLAKIAREAAERAIIPESEFPVGCALQTSDGSILAGCNVEVTEWTLGLCAERVAISTAVAYEHRTFSRMHLVCPKDENASPCGACRQVLFEFSQDLPITMDRGSRDPETTTPKALLPGGFSGEILRA